MTLFLTVLHVVTCVLLVAVVLLQRGKGAEIGAVFGGGASTTVFGSRGAGNFFTRLTTGAAVVFMLTSLALAYTTSQRAGERLFDEETAPPLSGEPLAPGAPGAPESPGGGDAPAASQRGGAGQAEAPTTPEEAPTPSGSREPDASSSSSPGGTP